MSSTPTGSTPETPRLITAPRVIVATTAMLTFISFWRAAAIVLNDMASSAYYAGGEAENFIGKSAPWFILIVMLFSGCVMAVYIESCSMFVRGGVYRVVKEALGGKMAKFSVSALMFDYILTGPISGVAAGQYLAGLINELLVYFHVNLVISENTTAALFAVVVTLFFWWENIKGIPESSHKALRIMQITTVMVVILLVWCCYTIYVRGAHLPPLPWGSNIRLDKNSMGWLYGSQIVKMIPMVAVFVGIGHSVLAMTGEESLAQVYREMEAPKLKNLKKAGIVIFIYTVIFTSMVSFFAVMIIPDNVRGQYLENLIGGLAMNLVGPFSLRLIFHVFVVVVGTMILAGAVNTAIVGSNGVLNRVSEDGVLADWFRQPHKKFGTSHRIINMVVIFQVVTIIASRGDVTFLANLYAFGVIWSFTMQGLAVLVIRYTHPDDPEYRVPFNFRIAGREIPMGLALITLMLLLIAVVNLFTKPEATIGGTIFTAFMFTIFTFSERSILRKRGSGHVEMDQFNVAGQEELSLQSLGVRPGNILVPVSNYHALYHLQGVLDRVKPERRDVVVLHIRLLRRSSSGPSELDAEQLFGSVEQYLFSQALSMAEKRGKTIRLAVVSASDTWGGILNAAAKLQSNTIVLGRSAKETMGKQAREIGLAWEQLPDPRPQFNLEIVTPGGQREIFLLGPHAPNLTSNEVRLVHRLWLRFSDLVAPDELHHHDVVHFALDEVLNELNAGKEDDVVARLKEHVSRNKASPPKIDDGN
ncbi:MAG TPA: APC family permease [Candidatus Dormibacteraeota bacterium]|nr:APC family permease [Candidatus Dormibacteraeota bacterium]